MPIWSMSYRGYTISGRDNEKPVQYQSPAWPDDPRIVKAPSLDTAKRWIREVAHYHGWVLLEHFNY